MRLVLVFYKINFFAAFNTFDLTERNLVSRFMVPKTFGMFLAFATGESASSGRAGLSSSRIVLGP